jgi:hypothetical protein
MAVRVGMTELAPHSVATTTTYGIGYDWRHIVGIDYSFTPHPDLLSTHRVSLQFTPAFPKLNGRGFRPHPAPAPASARPVESVPPEEGEIEEPASPPASPAPASAPNAAVPAAPAAPAAGPPAPANAQPAAPAPQTPQPAPAGEKEILEED